MYQTFWWDYVIHNFLFYGCNVTTILILIVTCAGLLCLSMFFEWMKLVQAKLRRKRILSTQEQLRIICPGESDNLLTATGNNPQPSTSAENPRPPVESQPLYLNKKLRILHGVYDIGLWIFQNILAYILMLAVMMFNGYLMIAIVVGSGIGYFVFGPTLIRINIENCRAMRGTFCMADCGEPDKTALLGSSIENQISNQTTPVCHQTQIVEVHADSATNMMNCPHHQSAHTKIVVDQ